MNRAAITLDVDWGPDFMIQSVADELAHNGVRATWFVTHDSPMVDRLRENEELFELGIHPNFLPDSSHGVDPKEVLQYLLSIVPEAECVRMHALVQSAPILEQIVESGIRVDLSLFLPGMRGVQPVELCLRRGNLVRIPYIWSDDHEMVQKTPDWSLTTHVHDSGINIFNFHPVHVYLNSPDSRSYARFADANRSGNATTLEQTQPYVRQGTGTASLFRDLIAHIRKQRRSYRVKDLVETWDKERQ